MSQMRTQDARAVVNRALCMGALLKRGEFELTLQTLDDYAYEDDTRHNIISRHHDLNDRLQQWLVDENLAQHLTSAERNLLNKALASWSDRMIISTSWRVESLGVMLWALQVLDKVPPFDTQFEPENVLYPLDVLTPTIDFVWRAALRSTAELRRLRDQAELWNWRARSMELERMGVRPPTGVTFREIVRMTARDAYAQGKIEDLIDDDFCAFGKPFNRLSPDEYILVSAIAYERYSALDWLCELSTEWDSLPVDH